MREKRMVCPRVWEDWEEKPEPKPEHIYDGPRYPCPCCGYLTLPLPKEDALAHICSVCCWENDVFDPGEDDQSDENGGLTLREGRANYQRYGAVEAHLAQYVRPPAPEELP